MDCRLAGLRSPRLDSNLAEIYHRLAEEFLPMATPRPPWQRLWKPNDIVKTITHLND